jgi:hypothetical protein
MRINVSFIAFMAIGVISPYCFAQDIAPDPDRLFTPRQMLVSACGKGLADAGVALPWNMASVRYNPALLYSCRNGNHPISRAAYFAYGRDSLFDRFILPGGFTLFRKRDALASLARIASSGFGRMDYEAAGTYCRRVRTRANTEGALDAGCTVRYAYAPWETYGGDTLFSVRSLLDSVGKKIRPDERVGFEPPPEAGKFRENRISLDLGLFKPEIATRLDCGLTLENMLVFRWGRELPVVDTLTDTAAVNGDTVAVVAAPTYRMAYASYAGWAPFRYAVAALGWNLRIGNPLGAFSLSLPIDLRIYGLFDRSMKETYAILGGVQVHCMRDFFFRLGYKHAPGVIPEGARSLRVENNISFGASVLPAGLPLVFDFYATHNEWGMGVNVDF